MIRPRTILKKAILLVVPSDTFAVLIKWFRERRVVARWRLRGSPVPPPHAVKARTIRSYKRRYDARVLVETGTYYGDMILEVGRLFSEVHTIELSESLHAKATQRLAPFAHVHTHLGDSSSVLYDFLPKVRGTTIFWLDGHYSGGKTAKGPKDYPVFEEIAAIANLSATIDPIVLIDDARLFTGERGAPALENVLKDLRSRWPGKRVTIKDDIIRLIP